MQEVTLKCNKNEIQANMNTIYIEMLKLETTYKDLRENHLNFRPFQKMIPISRIFKRCMDYDHFSGKAKFMLNPT